MTIATIRPTSTSVNTMTLTGSTAHAALSDNSDSSYVTAPYPGFSETIVGFSGYTLAAGSTIKQVRIRVRYVTITPGAITLWYVRMKTGAVNGPIDGYQSTAGPTPVDASGGWRTTTPSGTSWTAADVNALLVDIYPGLYSGNVQMPRIFEVYADIETNTNPTSAITSPATGGSVTTTTRPPVVFSYADVDGDPMEAYRVRVFTSAQYSAGGFDPNVSASTWDSGRVTATSPPSAGVPPTIDLTNSVTYRAYVWVYQQGSTTNLTGLGVSTAGFTQFTINVTPPPAPTISATAGAGFINVAVAYGVGSPATSTISVERSIDGGTTWTEVRHSPTVPGTDADSEAPPNRSVTYRARGYTAGGIVGPYSSVTAPVTAVDNDWRLKNPFDFTQNIILTVLGTSHKTTKPEDKAFFSALGRTHKVSVADVIKGEEGSLTVDFVTEAAYLAFVAMRAATPVLLLVRGWTGDQWYVSLGQDVEIEVFNYTPAYRTVTFPWVEVDMP